MLKSPCDSVAEIQQSWEKTTALVAIFSASLELKSLPLQELPAFTSDFVGFIWLVLSQVIFSFKVMEFAWVRGKLCENSTAISRS